MNQSVRYVMAIVFNAAFILDVFLTLMTQTLRYAIAIVFNTALDWTFL